MGSEPKMDLEYSDSIAGARTMIAVEGNAAALQRRLPDGWELSPYAGDDLRGSSLRGANVLVPFHEVFAIHTREGQVFGLPQSSYVAFVSQARHRASGTLGHVHWHAYTEDPGGVPGKYNDATLAEITRTQTFSKARRGETLVHESLTAVAERGEIRLTLAYRSGGKLIWLSAPEPNLALYAAKDPRIVRVYQEDQVIDVVRSVPLKIDTASEINLQIRGELDDVFDGRERVIGVVVQRPYVRHVHVAHRVR